MPDVIQDVRFDSGMSAGANLTFLADVTALRGANSIEQIDTSTLSLLTTIEIVASNQLSVWQLQTGTADPLDPDNQIAPVADGTIHWQRVTGFGTAMLAGARLTNSVAISVPTNLATALSFDTSRFNGGEFNSVTFPTRITCITSGVYAVAGAIQFAANATGQRQLSLRLNGSTVIATQQTNAAGTIPTALACSTIYQLTAGDYLEIVAYQNSGGSLNILQATAYTPEFGAIWVGSSTVIGTSPGGNDGSGVVPGSTTGGGTSTTPPPATGDIVTQFSISDVGWYRFFVGSVPSSGSIRLQRLAQDTGTAGDFLIDFAIIGDVSTPNEGSIRVSRNVTPVPATPPLDQVRVSHIGTNAYCDVHLTQSGNWQFTRSGADTGGFVDAPFGAVETVFDGSKVYAVQANVTGGTMPIDVPKVTSVGNNLLVPPSQIWAAWTNTLSRATRDTSTATTQQCAQAIKAIIDDLIAPGVFRLGLPSTMLYTDMLSLSPSLVSPGSVATTTDPTKITAQTGGTATITGTYVAVETFNTKTRYFLRGYEYKAGTNVACCSWNSGLPAWEIYDTTGARQFHQNVGTTNVWDAATWKDQANATQTVTFTAPNIAFTYTLPTDTHTACHITGSSLGFNGLYLRGTDLNGKRRYFLVGTSTNNKRIEWSGSAWFIKDDSTSNAQSPETVTFPDQVVSWAASNGDAVSVIRIDAYDLSSGVTIQGMPISACNGLYVPEIGANNTIGGRQLVYRNFSTGAVLLKDAGGINGQGRWQIYDSIALGSLIGAENGGNNSSKFPWEEPWLGTAQQSVISAPDFWV